MNCRIIPGLNFKKQTKLLFSKWKNTGVIEQIHELLRYKIHKKAGREISPSLTLIDSQTVKTTRLGDKSQGVDGGGKKIKGRKRHT